MTERDVTLFTHPSCPDSRKVRAWLQEHGVDFLERDVIASPESLEELRATGKFVTPLLVVGDQHLIGYRPDLLRSLFV